MFPDRVDEIICLGEWIQLIISTDYGPRFMLVNNTHDGVRGIKIVDRSILGSTLGM